jgi:hypothetical protein
VNRSITLVHFQLDAQNSYLFINNLSFRSCDSCRRLPEPRRHSFLFNHLSASKCLVVVAARTPFIHIFLGRPLFLLLFTYNTFIKILYMFRALPYSSSGGLRRNCKYAASGIVTVCR